MRNNSDLEKNNFLQKDNDGIWKEADYCKVLDELSKIPVKPLPVYWSVYNSLTKETQYASKELWRVRRRYQKEHWRQKGIRITRYRTTERDIEKQRELKAWNRGFVHGYLDFFPRQKELELLVEKQPRTDNPYCENYLEPEKTEVTRDKAINIVLSLLN